MMTSPSPTSLDWCSEELTARNHGPQPVPPRAVAAQSPFHEVLIEILIGDLAAWLPAPLGQRLAATTSVEEFHQLLGAGILYGWIAHDPCLAQLFLHALDGDPKRAALALAQALSACSDPPPGPALCGDRNLTAADYAPRAALNLGLLLKKQGDVQGARTAYQRAIDSGHADAAPRAAFNLGVLLKQQRDAQGARAAYQRVMDSGHADYVPKAALNLGLLLKKQGDAQGAKATYQRAIDSGHADAAPKALFNLGLLLEQQGDAQGARAAFQRALDSGHTDIALKAAAHLRRLSE